MIRYSSLNKIASIVVLVITQLHLLRNYSPAYFFIYLIAVVLSVWIGVSSWRLISRNEKISFFLILAIFFWPIFSIIFGVIQNKYDGFQEIAIGISRVLFALPIYLAILCAAPDKKLISTLLATSAAITLVASLSIPYQFIFGSVGWFAESSERAGLERFASLFGSLTALGVVCGFGILASAASFAKLSIFSLLTAGIIVGSLLSLQKAAIINMVLTLILLPFVRRFTWKQGALFIILAILVFASAWAFFGEVLNTFISSVRISPESVGGFTDDVSISESILDRILDLPSIAVDYHGWFNLMFGLGPIGGSGAFGYPDIPMSHNGLVDLFLIGGVFYFFLFSGFIIFVLKACVSPTRNEGTQSFYRLGMVIFLGVILNMIFSGLTIFSPSNSMFFALAVKCLLINKKSSFS